MKPADDATVDAFLNALLQAIDADTKQRFAATKDRKTAGRMLNAALAEHGLAIVRTKK